MATSREQEIRERAYRRYVDRGQQPGQELDDWIEAERELRTGGAPSNDPAMHKGVVEGDRPGDRQQSNRKARKALDQDGLPNDPIAVAQDAVGARADKTQG